MAKTRVTLHVGKHLIQSLPYPYQNEVLTVGFVDQAKGLIGVFPVFKTKKQARETLGKKADLFTVSLVLRKGVSNGSND